MLATLSAAGSTVLMLHFLRRLVQTTARDSAGRTAPTGYILAMARHGFRGRSGSLDPLSDGRERKRARGARPGDPLGGVVAGFARRGAGRWAMALGAPSPAVPEGDIVVAGEAAMRATVTWGEAIERADAYLRQWPVASLSLLALVIILGAAMLAWG